MQGKSVAVASSLPVAADRVAEPMTDRLPWPHAGRVVAGLSLLGWVAILTLILPVIG
jgi:hypothetical protein